LGAADFNTKLKENLNGGNLTLKLFDLESLKPNVEWAETLNQEHYIMVIQYTVTGHTDVMQDTLEWSIHM
jgi:hypothetical protein